MALTNLDHSLRPGLHLCQVGDLYDWQIVGRVGVGSAQCDDGIWVDRSRWPGADALPPAGSKRGEVYSYEAYLPPASALAEGEKYLLCDWTRRGGDLLGRWLRPAWHVVRFENGKSLETGYVTVARNVCPECLYPVTLAQYRHRHEWAGSAKSPHDSRCLECWAELQWVPSFIRRQNGDGNA